MGLGRIVVALGLVGTLSASTLPEVQDFVNDMVRSLQGIQLSIGSLVSDPYQNKFSDLSSDLLRENGVSPEYAVPFSEIGTKYGVKLNGYEVLNYHRAGVTPQKFEEILSKKYNIEGFGKSK
jgi:hypothetical protein